MSAFTIQLDDELSQALEAAAHAAQTTAPRLMEMLVRDYIAGGDSRAYDAWFREQVAIGLAAADAGRLVSNEVVETEFSARRAAWERPRN